MVNFRSVFFKIFRLNKKVAEWAIVKTLTSDKTDSLRDKSLFWGGIAMLLDLSGASAGKLFVLEFDPPLGTHILSLIVLILSAYYFIHWVKSIQSDVIGFQIRQLSDPIVDLGVKLDETRNTWNNLPEYLLADVSNEREQLQITFAAIKKKERQLRRASSYRNLLFWLVDVLPMPIMLSINLYLFFTE